MDTRNQELDIVKGLCIIMVVAIHTINVKDYESFFGIGIRNIFNCAVPIFLALSAYLTKTDSIHNRSDYKNFIVKRIKRIYVPTLIWSIPFFLYDIIKGKPIFQSLLLFFICGYSVFYFIALLIQYNLLIRLMSFLSKSKNRLLFSLAISLICVSCLCYLFYKRDIHPPLIIYAGFFPLWLVFFVFGLYLKGQMLLPFKYSIALTVISLFLSVLETYFYSGGISNLVGLGIKPSAFLFSFFMIQVVFYYIKNIRGSQHSSVLFIRKLLAYIGRISFGIYLSHVLILTVLKKVFPEWSISLFCITIIVNVLLIIITTKVVPQKVTNFLGF